ncbi:DUF2167 domain-containing protein [Rhodanobacter sp. DHB23]|uniref:DUF2167 domain-containing protein n=1 Tax=Rhodanobacter sp. DHB23 TaxID=2775923 RepID=UPI00177BCF8A|nr:DUF2167 domain-containing protein [Rhodanobacter sp. DHB23]MBD8872728.1 DUF2167 domain-containing protein [Rhodanobacter sp. DHB23]
MKCKLLLVLLAASVCLAPAYATGEAPSASSSAPAAPAADAHARVEEVLHSLHPVSGQVAIPEAQATLQLKPGYGYLQAADARRVLTQLWNNPPDDKVLGMILPSTDPAVVLDEHSWAVVVTYVDDGYVSDEDAGKIDYDDLLKNMQKATQAENEERTKRGYPTIELLGWAEPPHYDAASHKLYWARSLAFKSPDGSADGHTLNYAIRVLGRRGYLSLNAVAPIEELGKVRADMPAVLAMTDFDAGQRYADYDARTDKLAAYGIAALVAGGIAAKAGLFAKLGLMLLALKKFIIIGVAAVAAAIRKLFKRKQ